MSLTIGNNVSSVLYNGNPVTSIVYNGVTVWNAAPPAPTYDPYFTVTVNEKTAGQETYIALSNSSLHVIKDIYVWLNTIPNSDRSNYTSKVTINTRNYSTYLVRYLQEGDVVRLYCPDSSNHYGGTNGSDYMFRFVNGKFSLSGDISSLIGYSTTLNNHSFNGLFYTQWTIIDAGDLILPFDTLPYYSCSQMFAETRITRPPVILATTLGEGCCQQMFNSTKLTYSPELLATTLTTRCYFGMFYNCTSLTNIKCYATTGLNNTNAQYFTLSVPSGGTFYKAAGADWSGVTNGIPSGWTVVEV